MPKSRGIKYGPLNVCIYCGNSAENLTDEHIMPLAWGGDHILVKASCEKCQRIINDEFENEFLRLIKEYRYRENIGAKYTRRPRPKELQIWISSVQAKRNGTPKAPDHTDGTWRPVLIPTEQHPAAIYLPILAHPPGIMSGLSEEGSSSLYDEWAMWHHYFEPPKMLSNNEALYWKVEFDPTVFLREFAKIAHGLCVETFGLTFNPLLKDVILHGDMKRAAYTIGCSRDPMPNTEANFRFEICYAEIAGFGDCPLVLMRPMAKLNSPIYAIVVGTDMINRSPIPLLTQKKSSSHI